jgi:hypothetical protein
MKIAILNYSMTGIADPKEAGTNLINQYAPVYDLMPDKFCSGLYIFRRAATSEKIRKGKYTVIFHRDSYPEQLRWCNNPVSLHQKVADLDPGLVHLYNLDLPLHFRWLRNQLPENTKIIGHHTGEHIWIQLRLFLQQFGLRTADGFIFEDMTDAAPWLKASIILPRQPVFELPNGESPPEFIAGRLNECYSRLLDS